MIDLQQIAQAVRMRRKELGLTQHQLAARSGVSRPRIAALETGRLPEMGFKKLLRILHAMDLDLRLTALNRSRPTLEDLRREEEDEQLDPRLVR